MLFKVILICVITCSFYLVQCQDGVDNSTEEDICEEYHDNCTQCLEKSCKFFVCNSNDTEDYICSKEYSGDSCKVFNNTCPEAALTTLDPDTSTNSSITTLITPSTADPATTQPVVTTTTPNVTSSNTTSTTAAITTTISSISPDKHTSEPGSLGRRFDAPSFIGGIILSVGFIGICFISFKFYKARKERNYHTLHETVHM